MYEKIDFVHGYEYIGYNPRTKEHCIRDLATGVKEIWVANKNHASFGLIYKNTHLEFCHSLEKVGA